jgi:hypothetical protein
MGWVSGSTYESAVSAGFATVHGNNSLTINAVEAYPLDKFSVDVSFLSIVLLSLQLIMLYRPLNLLNLFLAFILHLRFRSIYDPGTTSFHSDIPSKSNPIHVPLTRILDLTEHPICPGRRATSHLLVGPRS